MTAKRPGFEALDMQPNFGPQKKLYQTVNATSNDFKLELTPEGSVTGVVNNADGNPIAGIHVQALTEIIDDQGRKRYLPRGGAATDETGTYCIENLRPGSILLRTSAHPLAANKFGPATEVYPESYYPNTPHIASAQPIEIKPGQGARADFSLTVTPVYSVSGTISGSPSNRRLMVMRLGEDGMQRGPSPLQYDPRTGQFVIRMVPPGTSTFRFFTADRTGDQYEATEQVNIASVLDIENVSWQYKDYFSSFRYDPTAGVIYPGEKNSNWYASYMLANETLFLGVPPSAPGF